MFNDFTAILLLVGSCIVSFTTARFLSRKWRAKRREKEELERRAGESRQVRRARDRRKK